MAKPHKNVFLTTVLVLSMAGCASTGTPPSDADPGTPATAASEVPEEGLVVKPMTAAPTPAEIKDFGDRIRAVPEALYSVVHNSYSIYLGGQFTATYHADEGSLEIISDRGDKTCTYSAKAELKETSEEAVCRQWLNELNDALIHLGQ